MAILTHFCFVTNRLCAHARLTHVHNPRAASSALQHQLRLFEARYGDNVGVRRFNPFIRPQNTTCSRTVSPAHRARLTQRRHKLKALDPMQSESFIVLNFES